jgi:hypothetical protein
MILNAISGFSASTKPEEESLSGFLTDVLNDMPDKPASIHRNNEFSSKKTCIEDSIRWMHKVQGNRIMLVGKSMGGVRTWWMVYHFWANILARFNTNPDGRLGVFLIDPHGWQLGDGVVGSYGLEVDSMRYRPEWSRVDVRIRCLYQRNDYPKGARLGRNDSAVNMKLGKGADHWNVEDFKTETGKIVCSEIQEMVRWVSK